MHSFENMWVRIAAIVARLNDLNFIKLLVFAAVIKMSGVLVVTIYVHCFFVCVCR